MERHVIFDNSICTKSDLIRVGLADVDFMNLDKFKSEGEIIPGDAYLCIGKSVYEFISKKVHLGLRKVTFFQVTDLQKVTTHDGTIFSFLEKAVGTTKFRPRAEYFMSKQLFRKLKELPEESKLITKDLQVAMKWLREWIDGTYTESNFQGFGLDYETANVTDGNKKICGVGIASITRGIFIDFRFPKSKEEWKEFSKVYIEFLTKFMDDIWVYNAQFEFDRTVETFGVRIDFKDAGAMNVVDGRQKVFYSLKYTAQYYLGVFSWDDDFDDFAHYLRSAFKKYKSFDEMFKDESFMAELKSKMIDEDDFNEWKYITTLVPEYYNDPYWNQTSRLLGKYCIMDSYYTLMIAAVQLPKYPEIANTFIVDNLRLGCELHAMGCFIDRDKREYYNKLNWKYQAMSAWKLIEIYYRDLMSDQDLAFMNGLSTSCRRLIDAGLNPRSKDFIKNVCKKLTDEKSERDISEYTTYQLLGEHAEAFLGIFIKEKKSIKSVSRSKRLKAKVEDILKKLYTDTDIKILKDYDADFSEYKNNQRYSNRLRIASESPLMGMHFNEVAEDSKYFFDGKDRTLEDITMIFRKKWGSLGSPAYIDDVINRILNMDNGWAVSYLRLLQKDKDAWKLYWNKNDSIKDPIKFYDEWKSQLLNQLLILRDECDKWHGVADAHEQGDLFEEFIKLVKSNKKEITDEHLHEVYLKCEPVLSIRCPWKWNKLKWDESGMPHWTAKLSDGNIEALRPISYIMFDRFKDDSFLEKRLAARKRSDSFGIGEGVSKLEWVLNGIKSYHIFKLYSKESQYLNGLFKDKEREVEITKPDLSMRSKKGSGMWYIPTKFNICRLDTKRSSSGFHTIPHGTAIKGVIRAPKGYAMSYFDVSQAEPRTCAYLLDKDKMRECYETGKDLYMLTAASMKGMDYDEFCKDKANRKYRGHFKTILLGLLYGMGAEKLGKSIGEDEDTAKQYIKALFDMFPKLSPAINEMKRYPLKHNLLIKTFWGDKLTTAPGREDQMMRHGINYAIQGNTSLALTAGFYNVIARCRDAGMLVRPVLAVHDALINYFKIEMIFDLNAFYNHNFEKYLFDKCGVRYKFSVDYGVDYYNVATVTNVDKDTINISGKNSAICGLLTELKDANYPFEILDQEVDPYEVHFGSSIEKHNSIRSRFCVYDDDFTENSVTIRRLEGPRYYVPTYE